MRRSDFQFELPTELIAHRPSEQRSASRLLQVPTRGGFADRSFCDVVELLSPGDLLVVNDSRVIRARLTAYKESGGKVELLVERLLDDGSALVHARSSKPLRPGIVLNIDVVRLCVQQRRGEMFVLKIEGGGDFETLLERYGEVPLPPYIRRRVQSFDEHRYQTVYAKHPGSVAAPTAGLHFDRALLKQIERRGVEVAALTLHVAAGTFQPLRRASLNEHRMHEERVRVDARLCSAVAACRCRGGRVVAVGTTVVRALETAADKTGSVHPYDGETDLFIRPGYRFQVSDVMITNFHLPETTLFVLVCAFVGRQRMLNAYRHAITQRYRFFSYGDATWLERNDATGD